MLYWCYIDGIPYHMPTWMGYIDGILMGSMLPYIYIAAPWILWDMISMRYMRYMRSNGTMITMINIVQLINIDRSWYNRNGTSKLSQVMHGSNHLWGEFLKKKSPILRRGNSPHWPLSPAWAQGKTPGAGVRSRPPNLGNRQRMRRSNEEKMGPSAMRPHGP